MSPISSSDIVQDQRIKEQNFGNYENIPISEWIEMAKQANVQLLDLLDYCPESGENYESVRNRTRVFLKSVISKVWHLLFST